MLQEKAIRCQTIAIFATMKKHIKILAFLSVSFLTFSLCFASCSRKPETCHKTVKFVNNSDYIVSICRITGFVDEQFAIGKVKEANPKDTVEVPMSLRWCLEEQLLSSPSTNFTFCILPETYTYVHTTMDSLEISYNILKTINLMEMGPDSLLKTDYTVYYP